MNSTGEKAAVDAARDTPAAMQCPLCGFRFTKQDETCSHGCPLRRSCNIECCPHCGYEFVMESRVLNWLKRRFGRRSHGLAQS